MEGLDISKPFHKKTPAGIANSVYVPQIAQRQDRARF